MIEISKKTFNTNVPIKFWVENKSELEKTCVQEAANIAKMPFAKKHFALMADCHASGHGMPIGGVLATEDVVIPDAVSRDIGCGIAFKLTDIDAKVLEIDTNGSGTIKQNLVGSIMRDIPTGFEHKNPKDNIRDADVQVLIDKYMYDDDTIGGIYESDEPKEIGSEVLEEIYEIVGTLGGGNHFLEFQINEEGKLGIMIHTGSRSVGAKVNKYFSNKAKELNKKWYVSTISDNINMPFLPLDSKVGQQYIHWMNFALEVAELNRKKIMQLTIDKLEKMLKKYTDIDNINYKYNLNVHHNYADYENVNGTNYFVHRKGAVRARESDVVPIPGAMGSKSYIAKGKGNDESFHSCSHGAGRTHTRTRAIEEFNLSDMIQDLKEQNIVFGKKDKSQAQDEYKKAYKDIDTVIENQSDLIEPIEELKTVAVIKG